MSGTFERLVLPLYNKMFIVSSRLYHKVRFLGRKPSDLKKLKGLKDEGIKGLKHFNPETL
jgi:hypothetical protein